MRVAPFGCTTRAGAARVEPLRRATARPGERRERKSLNDHDDPSWRAPCNEVRHEQTFLA